MKHGQNIPKDKRDDIARIAVGVAAILPAAEAKRTIVGMFDVSTTTARNLVSRGRFLTVSEIISRKVR